jgi:hypothetical protein
MICVILRLQQASPNAGITGVGEADSNTPANNTKSVAVSKNSGGASSPLHQLLQHSGTAFGSSVSTTVLSSSPTHHHQLDSCGMFFSVSEHSPSLQLEL